MTSDFNILPVNTLGTRLTRLIQHGLTEIGSRTLVSGEKVCFYCGQRWGAANADHITPRRAMRGVDKPFNKLLCCERCNRKKNGSHPVYFMMRHLQALPDDLLEEYLARILYHYLTVPLEYLPDQKEEGK